MIPNTVKKMMNKIENSYIECVADDITPVVSNPDFCEEITGSRATTNATYKMALLVAQERRWIKILSNGPGVASDIMINPDGINDRQFPLPF